MTIVRKGASEAFDEYQQDLHNQHYPNDLAWYSDEQIVKAALAALTVITASDPDLAALGIQDGDTFWYGLGAGVGRNWDEIDDDAIDWGEEFEDHFCRYDDDDPYMWPDIDASWWDEEPFLSTEE